MIHHTGIRVRDLERSRRFYVEGLGLAPADRGRTAAGGVWERLRDPETGFLLELNWYPDEPPYREGDELDHLAFRVRDLDRALGRLVALGGKPRIPAFEEARTRIAFVADPDGAWIQLLEPRGSEEPPTSRTME